MTTTITTSIDRLRRALEGTIPFTSSDTTTPILNAVHLKVSDERFQAAATDRYAAATYRLHRGARAEDGDEFVADDGAAAEVAIAVQDAKALLRTAKTYKRRAAHLEVVIAIDEARPAGATFDFLDGPTVAVTGVEGEYPPIARLFPTGEHLAESTQSEVIFDATFAAKVHKAAHALTANGHTGVHLRLNTDGVKPVVFDVKEDERWRGLLMPVRG